MRWLLTALLLVSATRAEAIAVFELTTGGTFATNSVTSSPVAPQQGDLLLYSFSFNTTGCGFGAVSGMGLTWTQVIYSAVTQSGSNQLGIYRAISDGTPGTVTATFSTTNCHGITWNLYALRYVNTSTNQGVMSSGNSNLTTCSTCDVTFTLPSYVNSANMFFTSCAFAVAPGNASSATFTFNAPWTVGSKSTSNQSGQDFMAMQSAWLPVKGAETNSFCRCSNGGGAGACQESGVEIMWVGGTRHKTTQTP